MALSSPRSTFGIHSVTPYSRTDGLPYGELRVLGGSTINLETELIDLFGGSADYAWASEPGNTTGEISLKFKEIPNFVFTLFLGTAPTLNAAEANGAVDGAFANKKGTSVFDASTGIATVTIKSGQEGDMKFNHYVVKAVSSTTVDVYGLTDVNHSRGDDLTFQNDALKLTSSPLTITASTAVEVTNSGVELTGGSGVIGLTSGDTAIYSTRPQNSESSNVTIGSTTSTSRPEFGCLIVSAARADGSMFEIDAFRCVASSFPLGMEENSFAEYEVTLKMLYDSSLDGVFKMRHVIPT